jgi:hypothetical protein
MFSSVDKYSPFEKFLPSLGADTNAWPGNTKSISDLSNLLEIGYEFKDTKHKIGILQQYLIIQWK